MRYIRELPSFEELKKDYYISEKEARLRDNQVDQTKAILSGKDKRKIVIAGPCSADRSDAVLDYTSRLRKLADQVSDSLLIIPRVYTGKPRTTGTGYMGMLHNPDGDNNENILKGICSARSLHLQIIKETGLFAADEMLYTEEIYYVSDLLGYLAVGARSVEDQGHRMLASDESLPVGMKNPTGGSKVVLINSIKAAQISHRMVYRGWEVETMGNAYAHAILRGYTDKNGKSYPNYHYEDIIEIHDMCMKENIINPGVIIDCNHSNSNKNYDEEPRIAKEVCSFCACNDSINQFVKGFMIESYLEDGNQMVGQGIYGKSITDPCIGWEKTVRLINEIAELVV